MQKSNTPRTDAEARQNCHPFTTDVVPTDFARTLETELTAAQEHAERLRTAIQIAIPAVDTDRDLNDSYAASDQVRSDVRARRIALISLRQALAATPSGGRFVRREVLADLVTAISMTIAPYYRAHAEEELEAANAELARTEPE